MLLKHDFYFILFFKHRYIYVSDIMDHDIDVFERQEGEQLRYIKVIVLCILKSQKQNNNPKLSYLRAKCEAKPSLVLQFLPLSRERLRGYCHHPVLWAEWMPKWRMR